MQFIGDIIVIRRTYEILNLGYFCFQKIRSLEAKCASLEKKDAYWCKKEAEWHLKLSQLTKVCFVLYLLFYCIRCTKHLCWNSSLCFGAYCVANSSSHVFCELPLLFWVSHSDHNFVLPKFSISFHSFVVLFQTIIIIIALGRSYSRELCMIRCLP
jgi:hypothetical protein